MTNRTKFVVYYQAKIARFSDYVDAHAFARQQSHFGGLVEIVGKDGMVGQYDHGKPTPEFAIHLA